MTRSDPSRVTPPPREGGGDKLLIGVAVVVATGLGGALVSFALRQFGPAEAPPTPSWHQPPSHKPVADAVPPAPTSVPPAQK